MGWSIIADRRMGNFVKLSTALPLVVLLLVLALATAPLNAQTTNSIPSQLRKGNFECDQPTIQAALELKVAGWTYVMPEPKSSEAAWGNSDKRTTWWIGYWTNRVTKTITSAPPKPGDKSRRGGDGNGARQWRSGGSPQPPHESRMAVFRVWRYFPDPDSTLTRAAGGSLH